MLIFINFTYFCTEIKIKRIYLHINLDIKRLYDENILAR